MEQKGRQAFGAFVASLRREAGLTQQEVAMRLGVANKTVSKWECGRGYPDVTLLPALAAIFSVTVDELLAGGKNIEPAGVILPESQTVQSPQPAWRENTPVFAALYVAAGLSLTSILLFFVLERHLLLPLLCTAILALCVICIFLIYASYRKALYILRNKSAVFMRGFISAFIPLYAAAVSLTACSCLQLVIYSLWVKSGMNIALPLIISLPCGAIAYFLIIKGEKNRFTYMSRLS